MRGTEEQFNTIIEALAKNCRNYEARTVKHIQYADTVDLIFSNYGWNKPEFYKELNTRLGIQTNETRKKKVAVIKQKPKSLPKKG